MYIRNSTVEDVPRMLEIYARARAFMAETGNPRQWGPRNWPPEELLRKDIAAGKSHVCVADDGHVCGTFYYDYGRQVEPTYAQIDEGGWHYDDTYGVVHRIASDGSEKGIGTFCLNWAFAQCGHLRIDTHGDNRVMQNLLGKLGFEKCGIIYVYEDRDPRIAFEKKAPDAPAQGQ